MDHPIAELPRDLDGLQIPQRVLQRRVASTGDSVTLQVLVQWSGLPKSLATWEDYESLHQRAGSA